MHTHRHAKQFLKRLKFCRCVRMFILISSFCPDFVIRLCECVCVCVRSKSFLFAARSTWVLLFKSNSRAQKPLDASVLTDQKGNPLLSLDLLPHAEAFVNLFCCFVSPCACARLCQCVGVLVCVSVALYGFQPLKKKKKKTHLFQLFSDDFAAS